ncbi:hypothetical protein CH373_12610 [Leptospira perolatii]|uniref:Uncharacterized protein n=1 Tax=Leptospira perolatii TaxID=2023191 RepID=A0A2M9ZLC9_9LEPT|nr:hypothetical protein [Leptospira perolatii]PJZ70223.1 hypothetical protein CH360_06360 [Leptospira perolatii]PJZ72892.1 hypothetical protein CH373_12610 [Leptospira perolatii]
MDKFFKTCFLLLYAIGLVFAIVLEQRWGKKDLPQKPVFGAESKTCGTVDCILREKIVVFRSLDASWKIAIRKGLLPAWGKQE